MQLQQRTRTLNVSHIAVVAVRLADNVETDSAARSVVVCTYD